MNCEPRFTPRIVPLEDLKRFVPPFEVIDLFSSGSQAFVRVNRVVRVANLNSIPMMVSWKGMVDVGGIELELGEVNPQWGKKMDFIQYK